MSGTPPTPARQFHAVAQSQPTIRTCVNSSAALRAPCVHVCTRLYDIFSSQGCDMVECKPHGIEAENWEPEFQAFAEDVEIGGGESLFGTEAKTTARHLLTGRRCVCLCVSIWPPVCMFVRGHVCIHAMSACVYVKRVFTF